MRSQLESIARNDALADELVRRVPGFSGLAGGRRPHRAANERG
jgi:hypothetical protein